LIKRGYVFHSDTDTEVLINLIEEVQKKENIKLGKAVQIALNQVVGAYAIAVFDKKNQMKLLRRLEVRLQLVLGRENTLLMLLHS
jgi:glucosamine--fructose-6-phosphate aminotransferase (isomerizing)